MNEQVSAILIERIKAQNPGRFDDLNSEKLSSFNRLSFEEWARTKEMEQRLKKKLLR